MLDEDIPDNVISKSLPFFICVSLPLAEKVSPEDVSEESKPIASMPSEKSVKTSPPEVDVIMMTSLPLPEVIVSLPVPPSMVSSPASP